MSGFPGPLGFAEFVAEMRRMEKDAGWRDTPEGRRWLGSMGEDPFGFPRTSDADDFLDAVRLRSILIKDHDRKSSEMLTECLVQIVAYRDAMIAAQKQLEEIAKTAERILNEQPGEGQEGRTGSV